MQTELRKHEEMFILPGMDDVRNVLIIFGRCRNGQPVSIPADGPVLAIAAGGSVSTVERDVDVVITTAARQLSYAQHWHASYNKAESIFQECSLDIVRLDEAYGYGLTIDAHFMRSTKTMEEFSRLVDARRGLRSASVSVTLGQTNSETFLLDLSDVTRRLKSVISSDVLDQIPELFLQVRTKGRVRKSGEVTALIEGNTTLTLGLPLHLRRFQEIEASIPAWKRILGFKPNKTTKDCWSVINTSIEGRIEPWGRDRKICLYFTVEPAADPTARIDLTHRLLPLYKPSEQQSLINLAERIQQAFS